jgi:hypothetical protein
MPYRRLPNTDEARIRSLRAAVYCGDCYDTFDLAISLRLYNAAKNFLPKLEAAQKYYCECYEEQAKASTQHKHHVKMARLYISHFIQVFNFCVIRSEIKSSCKKFYGLTDDNLTVPDLTGEQSIVEWGKKIIDGEKQRTQQGGSPIYNPSIVKVQVVYEIFLESYRKQHELQEITARSLSQLAAMRPEADKLILEIWNEVESRFSEIEPEEQRLQKCCEYGLIYYYRSYEKKTD